MNAGEPSTVLASGISRAFGGTIAPLGAIFPAFMPHQTAFICRGTAAVTGLRQRRDGGWSTPACRRWGTFIAHTVPVSPA